MATLRGIADFLDAELNVAAFDDNSNNGLQVGGAGTVRRVCCGVDASMEFFRAARDRGADLLVCHHGLSWADSLKRITGLNYERVAYLIGNKMALYACHLPLDAHPRHGNNACICRALGLRRLKPFGLYRGSRIGFAGMLAAPVPRERFKRRVAAATGGEVRSMDFGPGTVQSVAVVSGGAADELAEAGELGVDVFLTGEPKLAAYALAQEHRINAVFAGHYATEAFGVKALAGLLARRFGVESEFIDLNVPY